MSKTREFYGGNFQYGGETDWTDPDEQDSHEDLFSSVNFHTEKTARKKTGGTQLQLVSEDWSELLDEASLFCTRNTPHRLEELRASIVCRGLVNERKTLVSAVSLEWNSVPVMEKTARQIEEEKRKEGLATKLVSSNKGFALLTKLGYKEGDRLGKEGTGLAQPVDIHLKLGRAGLGMEAALKEKEVEKRRLREIGTNTVEREWGWCPCSRSCCARY